MALDCGTQCVNFYVDDNGKDNCSLLHPQVMINGKDCMFSPSRSAPMNAELFNAMKGNLDKAEKARLKAEDDLVKLSNKYADLAEKYQNMLA